MEGWIKMYRKFRENPIYKNSVAVHCWIECLLRASHTKKEFYKGRKKILLEPGSFPMGRNEFGKSIGISGSTALFWINRFKSDSMVDINTTNKGSIVTILNWKDYQGVDSKVDNKKTADEQQMNTNKNDKNVKNDKNLVTNVTSGELIEKPQDEVNFLIGLFKPVNPSYERLFANLSQRKAIERLVGKYGLQKIENAIRSLPLIVNRPYAPTITTPTQLESKLGDLSVFVRKEQAKQVKNSYEKL